MLNYFFSSGSSKATNNNEPEQKQEDQGKTLDHDDFVDISAQQQHAKDKVDEMLQRSFVILDDYKPAQQVKPNPELNPQQNSSSVITFDPLPPPPPPAPAQVPPAPSASILSSSPPKSENANWSPFEFIESKIRTHLSSPPPAPVIQLPPPETKPDNANTLFAAGFAGSLLISFFVAIWRTKLINAFNLLLWCAGLVTITVVTPVFVLPHFKNTNKLGMFIVLVTGYLLHALAASHWWLALYGAALVFAQYKEDHDKAKAATSVPSGRAWMNIMTRQILSYLTGLDVDEFDVGSALPTFREISIAEKSSTGCPGFNMQVCYNYNTDDNTKIKLWVPVTVPGYGAIKIPLFVSGPQIAGKMRFDGRIEKCSYVTIKDQQPRKVEENFFALAMSFDSIEDIHISTIKVLLAPKWEWLQWFDRVKREMKSFINNVLNTDQITVHLFDKDFVYVGSVLRKKSETENTWNTQDVVEEIKVCKKCSRKYFAASAMCCCDKIEPIAATYISGHQLPATETF
jgi:hypothetical protein